MAINNILKTEYKELQDASQYNMMLKGKNFRSAILFTMARAIYKTNSNSKINFEETRQYKQVATLAACIEIAHNASLL